MPPLGDLPRREVLRLIAAGAATALASCSKPDQPIYPRVAYDEGGDPGRVRRYATIHPLGGYWRGVTGLVTDARPIKLEGSDAHPGSLGSTDLFVETGILDLYDPQRLRAATGPNGVAGWSLLQQALIRNLAGSDGAGLRLLTGRITSPTLIARIDAMRRRFPAMRHVRFEAIDNDNEAAGAALAFGRRLDARPDLSRADVVLALEADPLGPGPEQVALARVWAVRRLAPGGPQRLHVIEPSMTLTGACADRRIAAQPGQVADALLALARTLGADVPDPQLPAPLAHTVAEAARDLTAAHGRAVVLVGRAQPPHVHALAHWVNARLAAPVAFIEPVDPDPTPHGQGLASLADEMHAGKVSTLVMLDVDPVDQAPAGIHFSEALARVPLSVSAGRFPSATGKASTWFAPLNDPLECWGDGRFTDGTAAIQQPLVRPLYRTRSPLQVLDLVDPAGAGMDDHAQVQAQWRAHAGADPARWWRDTLVAGVIAGTAAKPVTPPAPRLVPYPPAPVAPALTVALAPSPTLWDGGKASNAWAQECPDPLTKEVWGGSLRMHPDDARRLGVADGAVVRVGSGGTAPVRIVAGQAPGVATLLLGHGRRNAGPIAGGVPGANGFLIRAKAGGWHFDGTSVAATGETAAVPTTQHLFQLDGDQAKLFPVLAPGEHLPEPPPQATLLPRKPPPSNAPPQWAMVIDTAVCIGCNACVVACQAENNVPAIGPDQIAVGRDMHWLRVDRYDRGDLADPRPGFQPIPCMHCETAPCEPVCPVEASVHDSQGLNVQVYNRCVGTRTCQANCPYKVRRFNFLDYANGDLWQEADTASIEAQRNPDVTVRARGVMEKCTYCVQRIEAATRDADANGVPVDPRTVRTACEAACPTRAIRFGDKGEPEIAALKQDPRHYGLLEELGTRPRTTYLAKLRVPEDRG